MKRVVLFVMTNFAILIVLTVVTRLLGVDRYLTANGLDYGMLLGYAAVIGFAGAFISLLLSKTMAKASTGARVIEQPTDAMEQWLVEAVRRHAERAGVGMAGSGLYEGAPNAVSTRAVRYSAVGWACTALV